MKLDEIKNLLASENDPIHLTNQNINGKNLIELAESTPENPHITELSLENNQISSNDIPALLKLLEKFPNLKTLDLQTNNINGAALTQLNSLCKTNDKLVTIELGNNKITDDDFPALVELVQDLTEFHSLNLVNNSISKYLEKLIHAIPQGIPQGGKLVLSKLDVRADKLDLIVRFLPAASRIVEIHLDNNQIAENDKTSLVTLIRKCPMLTVLNLKNNQIHGPILSAVIESISDNSAISEINLGNNGITEYHTSTFALLVNKCPKLSKLNLEDNNIDGEGFTKFVDSLSEKLNITELYLGNNQIAERDIPALASLINKCPKLTILSLGGNKINAAALSKLAGLVKNNSYLTDINLQNNEISETDSKSLRKLLSKFPNLLKLSLANNKIYGNGLTALSKLPKNNPQLAYLDLENNQISGDDLSKNLLKIIEKLNLTELNLKDNQIYTHTSIEELIKTILTHTTLLTVRLEKNTNAPTTDDDVIGITPHRLSYINDLMSHKKLLLDSYKKIGTKLNEISYKWEQDQIARHKTAIMSMFISGLANTSVHFAVHRKKFLELHEEKLTFLGLINRRFPESINSDNNNHKPHKKTRKKNQNIRFSEDKFASISIQNNVLLIEKADDLIDQITLDKKINVIKIVNCHIDVQFLEKILKKFGNTNGLTLVLTGVSCYNKEKIEISKISNLQSLTIIDSYLTPKAIAYFNHLIDNSKELTLLKLADIIRNDDIEQSHSLLEYDEIEIDNATSNAGAVSEKLKFAHLKTLDIGNIPITRRSLLQLLDNSSLESLTLEVLSVKETTYEVFSAICKLSQLQTLYIDIGTVSSSYEPHDAKANLFIDIKSLTNLRKLTLVGIHFTTINATQLIESVNKLINLHYLNLEGCIFDQDIPEFILRTAFGLKSLYMSPQQDNSKIKNGIETEIISMKRISEFNQLRSTDKRLKSAFEYLDNIIKDIINIEKTSHREKTSIDYDFTPNVDSVEIYTQATKFAIASYKNSYRDSLELIIASYMNLISETLGKAYSLIDNISQSYSYMIRAKAELISLKLYLDIAATSTSKWFDRGMMFIKQCYEAYLSFAVIGNSNLSLLQRISLIEDLPHHEVDANNKKYVDRIRETISDIFKLENKNPKIKPEDQITVASEMIRSISESDMKDMKFLKYIVFIDTSIAYYYKDKISSIFTVLRKKEIANIVLSITSLPDLKAFLSTYIDDPVFKEASLLHIIFSDICRIVGYYANIDRLIISDFNLSKDAEKDELEILIAIRNLNLRNIHIP